MVTRRAFEIGSEFQLERSTNGDGLRMPSICDESFTFSGRTAIETVLRNEPTIKKVLLPSYCCESMIIPFKKVNIEVAFYPVNYDGKRLIIEMKQNADCILWCNYFGFRNPMPDLASFVRGGGIVIEDITHSFYSDEQAHEQSQYLVASLRKWEAVLCGGYCATRNKKLLCKPTIEPPDVFKKNKEKAMYLKEKYLSCAEEVDKQKFLELYAQTNEWLASHYSELSIDEYSMDYLKHLEFKKHRNQRISNASVIYSRLANSETIQFLFSKEMMDCPLFVPVILPYEKRQKIRKRLIDANVFCPVHWPQPDASCKSNLYEMELSLVCDHRYKTEDMNRVVNLLNDL